MISTTFPTSDMDLSEIIEDVTLFEPEHFEKNSTII